MLNNTTRRCPACGVLLRQNTNNSAVCPKCFREFCYSSEAFSSKATGSTDPFEGNKREIKIVLLLVGMICSLAVGLIPLAIFLIVMFVRTCAETEQNSEKKPEPRLLATGVYLKTRSDYIRVFRTVHFDEMPLGIYGARALHQLERLEQKQQALAEMLGKTHPFIRNGDEAEIYILRNCKQILYRLKYCDQNDPALCRVHADFLEERLADNEKVLRDFESLVIEVTQLNLDMPAAAPCLDVLADTLRNVRTQDGALPDDFEFSFDSTVSRQMMHG